MPLDLPGQFNGTQQNVGLQLGTASHGLTDVDLDCGSAMRLAPDLLPPTDAKFGRHSKPVSHWLYLTRLCESEKAVIKYQHKKQTFVELRIGAGNLGAQTMVPPSVHPSGETVMWHHGDGGPPASVDGLTLKRAVHRLAFACVLAPAYPGDGARHDAMLTLGGVLVRAGWQHDDIGQLVETLARNAGDREAHDRVTAATSALDAKTNGRELPGLPRFAELWGKDIADILRPWLHLRGITSARANGEDEIALNFAEQHTDDYRYVAKSARWMQWNGTRWECEDTLCAFDVARKLCREAGDARAKTVAAVTTLARADRKIAATVEQWDRNDDIFNAGTVTVDLKTGNERPPERLDYCTKQASVAPAPPGTPCDRWLKFLDRVTNKDDDLIAFLQRFCGYCLTGHTHEHVLAFLYGTGANGKGTFIRTIGGILADYCVTSPIEMFLFSKYDRHPTELARLHRVRLTVAQETPKGRLWDESKIKNLTGGDTVSARFMRADFFDFTPNFKVLLAGNYKPFLRNVDEAFRRRFLLIPFTVQIPKRERDPKLADKLNPNGRRSCAG